MKLRNALVAAFLLSSPAFASDTSVKYHESLTMVTVADAVQHRALIVAKLGEDTYQLLMAEIQAGAEVVVTFEHEETGEDRDGRDNHCTVKISHHQGGSGEVNVGGRAVGGGNANGHNDQDIEVSGPCDKVREIVNDIINGGETRRRDPGRHGNAPIR